MSGILRQMGLLRRGGSGRPWRICLGTRPCPCPGLIGCRLCKLMRSLALTCGLFGPGGLCGKRGHKAGGPFPGLLAAALLPVAHTARDKGLLLGLLP